ncbi:hypothetical protein [Photobacterium sp. 1_MG-2023]|uniref:transglycosylase SLT domain-containing protein n=1 Tax=Photobacterium sp. 1_MG-2023 TaxID=3062646 RepID=UPI0026E24F8E|nr:hypothetical protein [Photobacterium sp. 1_MG-2023]MDO6708713.1 hypothetical protein [Photobacterium sp. 1_MG-2023]
MPLVRKKWPVLIFLSLITTGCATPPPKNQSNLCEIFRENPDWYEDALAMEKQWGTPIQVAMAFVRQESAFRHDARPPRPYVLGFIPWFRNSSAYGYAQAQDPAWGEFQQATGGWSSRTDFDDSLMFIGWYTTETQRQLGISKWDAYNQYLAYHEGRGGYRRGTYRQKPTLLQVSRKVDQQAKSYGWQLKQCRQELEANRSWWPF